MKYILAFSLLFVATFTIAQVPAVPQASVIFSTLSQLTEYTGSLTQANWTDESRGGRFTLVDAAGLYVDSGIVFPCAKAGKFWKRDLSQSTGVKATWFEGFIGDSITDATVGLKRIRNFFHHHSEFNVLNIPIGKFRITDSVVFKRGIHIIGEGRDSSVMVRDFRSSGHGSVGVITFESDSTPVFIEGIVVEHLGFNSNASFLGHDQFGHQLGLLGTSNAIVRDCKFYNMRGDGIYCGAGKAGGEIYRRFNRNLIVENCVFDGGEFFRNRNGISLIDVDGITIMNNKFSHIGNDTLSRSVGCIDFERNSRTISFSHNVKITGNTFINCMALNTSALTMFTTVPPPYEDLASFFNVDKNEFDSCYWAISINNGVQSRPTDEERANIIISQNDIKYCKLAVRVQGRSVAITHNSFRGDSANYNNILVGHIQGANNDLQAQDIEIGYNSFDSCGQNGVLEIGNFRGLNIHDNVFTNRKSPLYFYIDAQESNKRKSDNLRIVGNRVKAPALNSTSAGNLYFINAPIGFNVGNFLINGNSLEEGNILENRVLHNTGVEFYLNHSIISAPPTVGSWDKGNELYSAPLTTGNYKLLCITGGTYGTDSVVNTFTATTSSNLFTSISGNVRLMKLREGQYITVSGSSITRRYKITGIKDSTGIYTDLNYDGGANDTVTTAWIAPVFVNLPVNTYYLSINGTSTRTIGNISTFFEGPLTTARTTTIGNDSTTAPGVRVHFRNITANGSLWTVTPDAGVTFNGSTSSLTLRAGEELDLLNTGINQWRIYYQTNASDWTLNGTDIYNNNSGNVAIGTTSSPYSKLTINNTSTGVVMPMLQLGNRITGFGTGASIDVGFGTNPAFVHGRLYYRFDTTGNSATEWRFQVYNASDSISDFMTIKGRRQVGIGTMYPAVSSVFDVASTTKGSRPFPMMTRTAFAAIAAKANGLFVFGTSLNKVLYYDSTAGLIRVLLDSATADGIFAKKTNTVTVNGNTQQLGDNPSFTVSTTGTLPAFRTVASNITNNVNTAADVTGISWSVAASKVYEFHIIILASVDNTGGITFKFTLPTSTTILSDFFGNSTSSTATMANFINASGGSVTGYVRFTGSNGIVDIKGYLQTTNSGTVQLQYNPTTTTQTVTILAGSSGTLWEVSAIGGAP